MAVGGTTHLTVCNLKGITVAEIDIPVTASVASVAERIKHSWGKSSQVHLIYQSQIMDDKSQLAAHGCSEGQRHVVQAVTCETPLARLLSESSFEDPTSCSVGPLVDDLRKVEHRLSAKWRPRIVDPAPEQSRKAILHWLHRAIQAVLQLPLSRHVELMHSTILSFDRYLDALRASENLAEMEHNKLVKAALACLCTELKLLDNDAEICFEPMAHQCHLCRISRNEVPLKDIYEMEAEVLDMLEFKVELPTPASFLSSLSMSLEASEGFSSNIVSAARTLLLYSLQCTKLLYSHPAVLLAGAALAASLRAHGTESTLRELVLEDLNAHDAFSLADLLKAEGQLLQFFVDLEGPAASPSTSDAVAPGQPTSPKETLALWEGEVASRADTNEHLLGVKK